MNTTINAQPQSEMPIYQAPTITTYTAEELLDIVGPVCAMESDQGDMGPMGSTGSYGLHKILKVV